MLSTLNSTQSFVLDKISQLVVGLDSQTQGRPENWTSSDEELDRNWNLGAGGNLRKCIKGMAKSTN